MFMHFYLSTYEKKLFSWHLVLMRIHVHVVPGSKKQSVEKQGEDIYGHEVYKVKIAEKPIDGAANKGVIEALAEHFQKPMRNIHIVSGNTSREKIIDII